MAPSTPVSSAKRVALGIVGICSTCALSCLVSGWYMRRDLQRDPPARVARPLRVVSQCASRAPAFGPGDRVYVTCDRTANGRTDRVILRLHARDTSEAAPPVSIPRSLDAIAVSRDGSRLVGIADRDAVVLDPREAAPAVTVVPLPIRPYLVTLSPDGRSAYLASDWRAGGPVLRLDTATGALRTFAPSLGAGVGACAMSLSPDGQTLAVGRPGPRVFLHATDTGRTIAEWGQRLHVYDRCPAVAFDPSGERLAEVITGISTTIRRVRDGKALAHRKYRWDGWGDTGYAVATWAPESLVGTVQGRLAATIDPETAEARTAVVTVDDPTRGVSLPFAAYMASLGTIYRVAQSQDGAFLAVAPTEEPVRVIRMR